MTRNILHHTSMRSTKYGGIEQFIVNLNQQLEDADTQITIQYETNPSSEAFCNAVTDSRSELLTQVTQSSPFRSFVSSLALYFKTHPALIITHFLSSPQYMAGAVYQLIFPKTQFISVFHLSPGLSKTSIATRCLNRFTTIIPVSVAVEKKLLQAGLSPSIIKQRYLGVFLHPDQTEGYLKGRNQLRNQMGVAPEQVVVGCLLFNHPVKGPDILIKAFTKAYTQNQKLHLLLVGIEPDDDLKKLLTEQKLPLSAITTPGIITDQALARMAAADIYVQPSRQEALGLALIEAAAMGLPLIGADTGGIPETVLDGITGELFTPEDSQQLATLLLKFSLDPTLRYQYGSAAANHYQQYFNGYANIQNTADIVSGKLGYPPPEATLVVHASTTKNLPQIALKIFHRLQQNCIGISLREEPLGAVDHYRSAQHSKEAISSPQSTSLTTPKHSQNRGSVPTCAELYLGQRGLQTPDDMLHILINDIPLLRASSTILSLLANDPPLAEVRILKGDRQLLMACFPLISDSVTQSQQKLANAIADLLKSTVIDGYRTAPAYCLPQNPHSTVQPGRGLIAAVLQTTRQRLFLAYRQRRFRKHWSIGLATLDSAPTIEQLRAANWQTINSPVANNYVADPFLLAGFNREWLLAEEFDRDTNKGYIVGYELTTGQQPKRLKEPLLVTDTHLSYPFTFEHDGNRFLMPENAAAGALAAYPLALINGRLKVGQPKLVGIHEPVYDASLFSCEDYFWIVGTTAPLETNTHLTFWYAKSPFGPWQRHRYNPVAIDVRIGRPAGSPFTLNGQLYLPLQDGALKYGDQIHILKVSNLSPSTIKLTLSLTINKQDISIAGETVKGIHTINVLNNKVAIDYFTYQ